MKKLRFAVKKLAFAVKKLSFALKKLRFAVKKSSFAVHLWATVHIRATSSTTSLLLPKYQVDFKELHKDRLSKHFL